MKRPENIKAAEGRLGVLLPGMGAVATTFIAGCLLNRKGLGRPIGSLTEMGHIRLGKRTDNRQPLIRDFAGLAHMDDLVFSGWDLRDMNLYEVACEAEVLEQHKHLDPIKEELSAIVPMPAVFFPEYVKRLSGDHVKQGESKMDLAEQVRADIRQFMAENNLSRCVSVWCGSTEVYQDLQDVHQSVEAFEQALHDSHPAISASMIYAYALIKEGVPYANGAPNLTVEIPALIELASQEQVAIAGKDFKTGQTLMKTMIAPGMKARMLGIQGWFSTNILGNRDGEVLDEPENFKSKEVSKLSVLDTILQPDQYPELYGDLYHKVRINYYPPRGDQKEGWDNIDITGWLDYPMQIKVDFLCRDSILAAPIVLDLVMFLDLANRAGLSGIQEWLSFYFKAPMAAPGLTEEHDLFIQLTKLKNMLRWMMGEELITHVGHEYYD